MTILYVILAALAPVGMLLWYIYRKDKRQPEPTKWLLGAFGYGALSVLVVMVLLELIHLLTGISLDNSSYDSWSAAFAEAFCMAAVPEELAKFLMLWLLLRKNPCFDEHFDGIVYAVCVGLGFAAVENVIYLLDGLADGSWVSVGIVRALFSVPGHFLFAVLMGYYYSLYHFRIKPGVLTAALVVVAPIIAHGLYDGILFCSKIDTSLSFILMILFLFFFDRLRKLGKKKIHELIGK